MSMQPLLIELGTEELPVKALPGLAQAFFDGVVAALGKRGVAVQAGDAMLTRPGGTDAIRQDGEEDLVLLIMYGKKQE